MAIIWQASELGKEYEVRSAGASLRLYTNGVFHSQYNPKHLGSGSLWDMLAMPCQLLVDSSSRNALVLGVGGGAVIRYLQSYLSWQKIVGVDLDSTHLYIAERVFNANAPNVCLECAEAQAWLGSYQHKFDLIVEDLFGEQVDEQGLPVRAVAPDIRWLKKLANHLSPDGMLIINLESSKSSLRVVKAIKSEKLFSHFVQIRQSRYENVVLVLTKGKLKTPVKRALMARMQERYLHQFKVTLSRPLY